MLVIDDILIGDAVIQDHFVCNLNACKGACCVEGESGAPLEPEELSILEKIYPEVKPYLTEEGRQVIETKGFGVGRKGALKTPLLKDGGCAYIRYENGVAQCGIQKAYREGKVTFEKPISCHLYPLRITKSKKSGMTHVNYEEWEICSPACTLGKSLKVPVYQFVKDALIRRFGAQFYETLHLASKKL